LINQLKYVVAVMFVAILVYSGLWYTAAFEAEKQVAAKFSDWRDQGLHVEHGKIEHGGFPYRITVTVKNFDFATRSKGLELAAKEFTLISHLWTPNHWITEAHNVTGSLAGRSTSFKDGFLQGSYKVHSNGKAMIVLNSGTVDDFELTRLVGQTPPKLTAWQLAFMLDDPTKEKSESGLYGARSLSFKVSGKTADQQLEITGGISGPVIKDFRKDVLANWRDEGGLIELDAIDYMVPGGRIKGSSSFTLDERFRPLGSASLVRSGSAGLSGLIEGFGLNVQVSPNKNGPASLMLQNGQLSLNGEQIATLKPVIN